MDTGAKCNVITKALASRISKAQKKPIKVDKRQSCKLVAYGGDSFSTIGTTALKCQHNGITTDLVFHVVDRPVQSLIGLQDSLKLKLITLSPDIHEVKTSDIPELQLYQDLFDGSLGKLPVKYKMTLTKNATPIVRAAHKIPVAIKDKVKAEINQMERDGIISSVTEPTDWVSNLVAAKKKGKDELRICLNPHDLNNVLKRPHHPLKTVEEVLSDLTNARVFTTLDAKNGFWQIPLEEESSKLTTFATPFGRYKFNRMPYGIKSGSEVFQRAMDDLFKHQPCKIVVDDILIWGASQQDHDQKLKVVLDRCREINLKLNPKKCRFRVSSVPYIGHILSDTGVHPDPEKVKAITQMPQPTDVKSLQRFLGMVNYLSKFIKLQSTLTASLRELLHKDKEFQWNENHSKALDEVKAAVANITTLQFYDVTKPVTITADVSQSGLGCALLQDGKPIHFASRALTSTESNMAQIQKELLAIVFATKKFRHYIYGKQVTVETDHKPLVTILNRPLSDAPASLQKMLLKLQSYDLNLVHKSTTQMQISDTLSRAYLRDEDDSDMAEEFEVLCVTKVTQSKMDKIREATKQDKMLQTLITKIQHGWPDSSQDVSKNLRPYFPFRHELIVEDGIIFKANRIVIPFNMRNDILEQLHYPHVGVEATIRRAKECVFWDKIQDDIKTWADACQTCASHKPYQRKEKLTSLPVPNFPWQIVATDVFEWHGKQYLLTTDSYSGWFEVDELPSLRSTTIIAKLKQHFSRFGIPATLLSDSAPNLTSQEFKQFCREWDIEHQTSSPEYHQANSTAELGVKRAKTLLSKCEESRSDFHLALLNHRNVPRENHLKSPAERLQSRILRSKVPQTENSLSPKVIENIPKNLRKLRLTNKYYYDKSAKNLPELRRGDIVRMQTKNGYKKLAIVQRAHQAPHSYVVESGGKEYRRNRHDLLQTKENAKMQNEHFLEDYVSLTRSTDDSGDQDHHNVTTNQQTDHQDQPDSTTYSPPPRRSQRQRQQHYQYQHLV